MFRPALRSTTRILRGTTPTSFLGGKLAAYRFLSQDVRSKIQTAVDSTPVVLFMKGTVDAPECGFSRAAVQILQLQGVPQTKLKTYNVLQDPELRSCIKEFSEWPTIPQLYVDGEFIGGCDIVLSMHQSGDLETLLEDKGVIPKVEEPVAAAPA